MNMSRHISKSQFNVSARLKLLAEFGTFYEIYKMSYKPNYLRKTILFVCLAALALLNLKCGKTVNEDLTYQATVYDVHNQPVAGASVELTACAGGPADSWCCGCRTNTFGIGTAKTDASGHFIIKGKQSRIDYYWITVNGIGVQSTGMHLAELPTVLHIWHAPPRTRNI